MRVPAISVGPDHPDFLDLDWTTSVAEWSGERVVDLPTGVHRHPIVFVAYAERVYAIKELPRHLAHHEYESLRTLRTRLRPIAPPVGIAERGWVDADEEWSSAVITEYVPYTFTYRELISGRGFGARRNQMLDAFAGLLVELHLAGCFWGDCSLSNVLYRYDAGAIDTIMIDAETVEIHDRLSDGQRREDLTIMEMNVAGGMADIALAHGADLDEADLTLGSDIIRRYAALWEELNEDPVIRSDERYRIRARIKRLNELGFEVDDVTLTPQDEGGARMRLDVQVGGRNYHSTRLRILTGIDAPENQARQILSDMHYHASTTSEVTPSGKELAAMRWRVDLFEPWLERIRRDLPDSDPVQAYCDLLHHRYVMATEQGRDIPNEEAYAAWIEAGRPGFALD